MRRQKNINNNNTERSVRRISYLRATANDISLQESDKVEENIEKTKDEKPLSDELQMLNQFFKRFENFYIKIFYFSNYDNVKMSLIL